MESNQKALKIIVPIILVVVIAGIWYFKNMDNAPEPTSEVKGEIVSEITAGTDSVTTPEADSVTTPESEQVTTSTETSDVNPDFALHVSEALDLEQLKSYGLPIMIDFGADSCIPCKEMAPVLEKLNKDLQGKAIIRFVDVWKYQEFSEGYPIRVIPTQVFFDQEGKPYTPSDSQTAGMNLYSTKDTNEHVFTTHEGGMTEEMILAALIEMGMEE